MTQLRSEHSWEHCREQALELLRRGWPPGDEPRYDPDHALMLCRMAGFKPGLIFLYEKLRLFREVLQVCRHCSCSRVTLTNRCMGAPSLLQLNEPFYVLSCIPFNGNVIKTITNMCQGGWSKC